MDYQGKQICGFREDAQAATGDCYWRINPVKAVIMENRLSGVSDEQFMALLSRACKEISDSCGLNLVHVTSAQGANILLYTVRIDGPSGTLAQAWLPCNPNQLQYRQEIDTSEVWWPGNAPPVPRGKIAAYPVILHETIHNVGLGHGKDIMAAHYDENVWSIGPDTKRRLVALYGERKTPVPSPPTPDKPSTPGGNVSFILKLLEMFWPLIQGKLAEWIADGTLAEWLKKILGGLESKAIKTPDDLGQAMAYEAMQVQQMQAKRAA